ncbi:hypothetical protein Bca101_072404 [Brassica carinata]
MVNWLLRLPLWLFATITFAIWETTIYKKQKMNPQTSMALREDVIQRIVYVSDIDQQVKVSSTNSRIRTSPVFGSQAEDEHEMRARTIYYTNIDTKAACGEVYRLRLLGDYHHPTRISFVEFVMAESAVTTLNCSGVLLGSLQIRVSPSNTPVCSRAISALPDIRTKEYAFKMLDILREEARRGRAVEMRASLCGGVANTSIILRDDEFLNYLKDHQKNFSSTEAMASCGGGLREPPNEQAVLNIYEAMRSELSQIYSNITDLEMQEAFLSREPSCDDLLHGRGLWFKSRMAQLRQGKEYKKDLTPSCMLHLARGDIATL